MITSLHIVRKALICATLLIVAGYDGIGTELRNRHGVSSVFQRDRKSNELWHVQRAGFWNVRHADCAD